MINPPPNLVYRENGYLRYGDKGTEFFENLREQIANEMPMDRKSIERRRRGNQIIFRQLLPTYLTFCVVISDYHITLKGILILWVLALAGICKRLT